MAIVINVNVGFYWLMLTVCRAEAVCTSVHSCAFEVVQTMSICVPPRVQVPKRGLPRLTLQTLRNTVFIFNNPLNRSNDTFIIANRSKEK